ncbi:MAG: gamma-glutamyltransferase [Bacteroidales bacterium]|nr:gamma-glutamyltransferase [Bacteroidales bacterium]
MTPTIVEKDGRLFLVVGTPGGSTIITSVYQTILNMIDYGMDVQQAINAKKTHSQWLPDQILYEKGGLDSIEILKLIQMGHLLQEVNALGRINAVEVLPDGTLLGGSDPRGDDTAAGVR